MDKKNNVALVLEGGGFRGMFTAGVLDVLQEHKIYDFSAVFGVSAGAINATSFMSKQIGRSMRIMLAFRDDRRFMSLWSLATTGNLAGGEFMYDEIQNRLDPSDNEVFNNNPTRMFAVATDVVFGTPSYLECKHFPDDIVKVQASASLPLVSKLVEFDGHRYLDGGTADSIPYEVALGLEGAPQLEGYRPADKALVVVTQDHGYIKTNTNEQMAVRSHRYDGYPYYLECLESRPERYNKTRKRLFALAEAPSSPVLLIEPSKSVEVATNEHDGGKLLDLYLQGRKAATDKLDEIRAFISA